MKLRVGMLIVTSYCCDPSRPYRIDQISGPCSCACYHDEIENKRHWPGPPHYHLVCTRRPWPGRKRRDKGWLNGYRLNGTSVWCDDRILPWSSRQLLLFNEPDGRLEAVI